MWSEVLLACPVILQCGTMPGWLEAFTKCVETLEAVQKGIEDYLETKRVAFPRYVSGAALRLCLNNTFRLLCGTM